MKKLTVKSKNWELTLPDHMTALDESDLEEVVSSDREDLVLCCGVDPDDSVLYVVTSKPEVRTLAPNGRLIPATAIPTNKGQAIVITFVRGDTHVLLSDLVVKETSSSLVNSKLIVNNNYICDMDNLETVVTE